MNSTEFQAAQKFLALHGHVKRCAYAAVPLPGHVDDIIQQVFVEFVSHADKWDMNDDLRPLLSKITLNISRKFWREHRKSLPPMLLKIAHRLRRSMEADYESSNQIHFENDEIEALHTCIARLPKKSRQLIQSYYFEGLSRQELALRMDVKSATVNRNIWRIREKLRVCIKKALTGAAEYE